MGEIDIEKKVLKFKDDVAYLHQLKNRYDIWPYREFIDKWIYVRATSSGNVVIKNYITGDLDIDDSPTCELLIDVHTRLRKDIMTAQREYIVNLKHEILDKIEMQHRALTGRVVELETAGKNSTKPKKWFQWLKR